jgi:hypothetical protein
LGETAFQVSALGLVLGHRQSLAESNRGLGFPT